MAQCVINLIENEELRKAMGEESYNMSKQFSKEDIMQKWINLFEGLTKNNLNESSSN